MSSIACKVLFSLLFIVKLSISEKCIANDMIFKYTECDTNGQRWRVSVPNTTKNCDHNSDYPPPIRARECKKPCDAGTYLDIVTQTCKECTPGSFSQGSMIEIDNWSEMPPGFSTNTLGVEGNCDSEKWQPKGAFLETTVTDCESHLIYTASLFNKGNLTFEYQLQDEDLIFAIKISNDNCQSTTTENNIDTIKYLEPSGPSKWIKQTFKLKTGRNIIRWMVVGGESHRSTVKIKYLKITKSIFLSECMKCAAGYFSSGKSSKCTPCPMNKFSKNRGSAQCDDCPDDGYTFPGSASCKEKVACEKADYGYKWTECDKQNQRKKIYYWITPIFCSDKKSGSVKLPMKSKMEPCPSCPSGTYHNTTANTCEFCPLGTASNKSDEKCNKCSPNTKPLSEINYDQWARPLPNLSFRCLNIDNSINDCNSNETWIYNGDNLQTSPSFELNLLQLDFKTKNYTDKVSSQFSFDFEINCDGYCALHLFLKKSKYSTKLINRWTNSTKRHTYNYNIPRENKGQIIWFFSRSRDYSSDRKTIDYLKIYSIKVTRVKNAGAVRCQFCNPKFPSNECVNCEKGKFFSLTTRKCIQCPSGKILKFNSNSDDNNCVKCGAGLIAVNGSVCLPDINFQTITGYKYNLAQLKGSHLVLGKSLFTTHGQPYQHLFNITLFSGSNSLSSCKNNATLSDDYDIDESGPLCRLTLISNKLQNGTVYAMQSIRLADKFVEIQQSNSSREFWEKMNKTLIKNGFSSDSYGTDLHFQMKSERKTDNCENGYGTTLTLRCDTSSTKHELLLPPNCAIETCDGCNFHILLTSKSACPECRKEDYSTITEECSNGIQKRHFQIPKYCVPGADFKDQVEFKCPLFTTKMEIGIIITASILFFLLGLVIYCHKKNKKLEYKYSRLISGNDDNENVLNGAESCGMHDDEDDEDDVKIKTNSKSGKIFAKYNRPSQYRNDKNSMERINLNENPDFDI